MFYFDNLHRKLSDKPAENQNTQLKSRYLKGLNKGMWCCCQPAVISQLIPVKQQQISPVMTAYRRCCSGTFRCAEFTSQLEANALTAASLQEPVFPVGLSVWYQRPLHVRQRQILTVHVVSIKNDHSGFYISVSPGTV